MNVITLGLSKILGKKEEPKTGDFTETGYTAYGLTYQDTAKMTQEDGEETEFYSEENDDPEEIISKAGKTQFSFSVMNPDTDTLKRLFGGEVQTNVYAFPDAVADVEEALLIIPRKGLKFLVPRARLKAKLNGEFSKKGLLLLEVVATVQKPKTAGLKKLYVTKIATT